MKKFIKFETTDNVKLIVKIEDISKIEEIEDGKCEVTVGLGLGAEDMLEVHTVLGKFEDIHNNLSHHLFQPLR